MNIDKTATISKTAIVGKAYRPLLTGQRFALEEDVRIAAGVYLGEHVIVGQGCQIGEQTIIDDFIKLDPGAKIGQRCLLIYSAHICPLATIGDDCVIGGFIGDSTKIGSGCRIFGKVVHKQNDPILNWDDDKAEESAAQIGDFCFVGFQALVVGPVVISSHTYITAGATVTRDVPEKTVVTGVNKHTRIEDWKGSLKESQFFHRPSN
jgi:UDP-3-O-[3-hydroxymyristoyl] glucosamine N-acyltransferase